MDNKKKWTQICQFFFLMGGMYLFVLNPPSCRERIYEGTLKSKFNIKSYLTHAVGM